MLVVADASLLTPTFVQAMRKGDPNRPILADRRDRRPQREGAHPQGRVTFHVRPLSEAALLLAVALAQAESRTSRRSPRKMMPRLATTIEGAPSVLLDVSNEGLRLEVDAAGGAKLVAAVRRARAGAQDRRARAARVGASRRRPGPVRTVQCGATLLATDERTCAAWQRLADPATGHFVAPRPAAAKVSSDGLFDRVSSFISNAPIVGSLAHLPWRGRS